jgi:hypothetical protein
MDEVVKLNAAWDPDGGAPEPRLLAADAGPMIVAYHVAVTDLPLGVLRFDLCYIMKFGYPNDEALSGHPLYEKGLRRYGLFEVLNSSWIEPSPNRTWWRSPIGAPMSRQVATS